MWTFEVGTERGQVGHSRPVPRLDPEATNETDLWRKERGVKTPRRVHDKMDFGRSDKRDLYGERRREIEGGLTLLQSKDCESCPEVSQIGRNSRRTGCPDSRGSSTLSVEAEGGPMSLPQVLREGFPLYVVLLTNKDPIPYFSLKKQKK